MQTIELPPIKASHPTVQMNCLEVSISYNALRGYILFLNPNFQVLDAGELRKGTYPLHHFCGTAHIIEDNPTFTQQRLEELAAGIKDTVLYKEALDKLQEQGIIVSDEPFVVQ